MLKKIYYNKYIIKSKNAVSQKNIYKMEKLIMVNRIFCYSYEEAERNGNVVSFGSITLFVLSIILLFSIAGPICIHNADNPMLFLLLIFAFFSFSYYILVKKMQMQKLN